MWQRTEDRLALLELLARGLLKQRQAQMVVHAALSELPWTRVTGRRGELALVEERRRDLILLLDRVWPNWADALGELTARGLPPTPEGWSRLQDALRAEVLPELSGRINRRTAAALAGPHSKSRLTDRRLAALGEIEATHDGTVRLRPPDGLVVRTRRGVVDLGGVARVLGEVAIPERAFLEDLALEGEIRAVLFVENLGAWRDLPSPSGWLIAHVAGWDTATVAHLFDRVTRIPAVHFGDLDPNGVRIFLHLRERRPTLRWFVPSFWSEFIESPGLSAPWPPDLDLRDLPPLVRELASRKLWLEQERIVLDGRVGPALEAIVREEDPFPAGSA
jgi:hypothetical protein